MYVFFVVFLLYCLELAGGYIVLIGIAVNDSLEGCVVNRSERKKRKGKKKRSKKKRSESKKEGQLKQRRSLLLSREAVGK